MGKIETTWVMDGVNETNPLCIHNVEELETFVEKVGFVPLFKNKIKGFSIEERTIPSSWWCDDPQRDPWIWRQIVAVKHNIAYGKFFSGKAGFISLKWLPYFASLKRDGYDFDARWDDAKAPMRHKKIMDLFLENDSLMSFEIKEKAGYGKDGEKNFEGMMTSLQEEIYLVVSDFKRKKNKKGEEYGWNVAAFSMPETIWGYETITSKYNESQDEIKNLLIDNVKKYFNCVDDKEIKKILKI